MSPVDGIGAVNPPAAPPANAGGDHAGHGGGGAAPTFATAYANALAGAAPAQAQPAAGHAHGASPAGAPAASPAAGGGSHGSHGASSTGGGPRFIPLAGQQHGGENHDIQELVLGLRAYRQQLIASNIANADTPHYKAVDIDFREAVRVAQTAMAASVDLATTDGRHIAASGPSTPYGVPVKYHVPQQPSADGNTVEMDAERQKFAENTVMYEFSLDRVKMHYSMMADLLKNLTN